jgi:hypothetical protein
MGPLEGFISKLNRADHHLRDVRVAVSEFVESDFYETTTELDRRGRLVGRAHNVKRPKPHLSVLIGDAVHNFRSALDHLAFQLAAAYTDPLPATFARTSAFPIFDSGPRFRGKRDGPGAARKMRGMSRSARACLERLQPYHRKNPHLRLLWMLEELSNVDKHRLLPLTGAVPMGMSFHVGGTSMIRLEGIEAFPGPIEEGKPLTRVHGEFGRPLDVTVKTSIAPDVAFDKRSEARSVRGLSVLDVLSGFRDVIAFAVLPELDGELARRFPEYQIDIGIDAAPGKDVKSPFPFPPKDHV